MTQQRGRTPEGHLARGVCPRRGAPAGEASASSQNLSLGSPPGMLPHPAPPRPVGAGAAPRGERLDERQGFT